MGDTETRNTYHFILDGQRITPRDLPPDTTLLNYLRDHLNRKGSKEGCAEGDCGACTVVVADLQHGRLRYRAINACIQFLPTLAGKVLYTVESLQNDQQRHPVQQAMLDCHASQCGFCTPGFVMSLFALYKTQPKPDHHALGVALSGNLCRCTGYRPILEAGQRMYDYGEALSTEQRDAISAPCHDPSGTAALINTLEELAVDTTSSTLLLKHKGNRYFAPQSVDELATLYQQYPEATLLAGGTDIGLWITKQHRDLPVVIYLGGLPELDYARLNTAEQRLEIGASTSLEDSWLQLVAHLPELQTLHERFASPPIRNAGTLVGNIANGSPIGDAMPALLVLDSTLVLRKGSERRTVPLERFYLGYQQKDLDAGEFIEAVHIPLSEAGQQLRCWKISKRFDQDISAVCAAFSLMLDDKPRITNIRIAFGGMAATPQRAKHTEAALLGQPWSKSVVEQAMPALANDFTPLTDMRASQTYRMTVAKNLLLKCWLETHAPGQRLSVLPRGNTP